MTELEFERLLNFVGFERMRILVIEQNGMCNG